MITTTGMYDDTWISSQDSWSVKRPEDAELTIPVGVQGMLSSPVVLAVGPIVDNGKVHPCRVVLADNGKELVVWVESFASWPGANSTFSAGNYFPYSSYNTAIRRFAKRIAQLS